MAAFPVRFHNKAAAALVVYALMHRQHEFLASTALMSAVFLLGGVSS